MKERIIAAAAVLALLMTGCSNASGGGENSESGTDGSAAANAAVTAPESTVSDTEAAAKIPEGEITDKIREIGQNIGGEFSLVTSNRLYDSSSVAFNYILGEVAINVRVAKAEYIPDAAFDLCGIFTEAMSEAELPLGVISISAYETDEKGYMIDETATIWRSKDGVTGTLNDAPNNKKLTDCTVAQLYEHFGDKVTPFTKEETSDIIKKKLGRNSSALLHSDENCILVSMAEGSIAVLVRTYKEFLIPAAAERAMEVVFPVAERSELPFSRLNVTFYDDDAESGSIAADTMIGWTTLDGETGRFVSKPEGIDEELWTIEDMYGKYSENQELIEKALNGERVDAE